MFRKASPSRIVVLHLLLVLGLFWGPGTLGAAEIFHGADPYAKLTGQVFQNVEKRYVDPSRAVPKNLLKGAFKALEAQNPQVLINIDETRNEAVVRVDDSEKRFDLAPAGRMAGAGEVLNGILSYVAARIPEEADEVDKQDVYYAGINGALSALDPHSNALSPKVFKAFMASTRGSFGGIGFVFGLRDGDVAVIAPIEGTPASRAGLRTGDKILSIDGEPTMNMPVDTAMWKMRGDPGTQVSLLIARDGWSEPRAFTFTREMIHVESVESYVLNGDDGAPVVYVKVSQFQKETAEDVRKAVRDAEAKHRNLAGIILDVRNDPGGLLDEAVALADGLMDHGTIVHVRGPEDEMRHTANGNSPGISKKPVILLVNQGSASASEIVAGALKSFRGLLIGQKTFGKGSVQKVTGLADGGALKLTVAQYLTPGDVSIQSIGVQPDVLTAPVQTVKGQLRLGQAPPHFAESELENAFKDWGNASEKPWREIQYLGPEVGKEEEKPYAELTRPEKIARIRSEFEVRLARRILTRVEPGDPSRTRERLFKVAEPVLEELRSEEDAKIARLLGEKGVDWTDGRSDPKPRLSVRFPRDARVEAGTPAELTLTVKNEGSQPVYRVWGRTTSDNPLLKNLDLPFGRIDPGKERSWTVKIEVPKAAADRWDSVTVPLKSGWNHEVGTGQGGVRQVAGPAPRFAYSYEVREENTGEKARANNGALEEGDRVELSLTVRNRGTVPVAPLEVNIRGGEGEQLNLEAGRRKIESLGPGEKKEVPMSFRLVKAEKGRRATVLMTISSKDHGLLLSDSLKLPVGRRLEGKEVRDTRTPPDLEFAKAPPLRTGSARVSLELKALDEEGVKDVYAYVGENKIQYVRNRGRSGSLAVHLDVPLEPGSNRLLVYARDSKNLVTAKTFHIFRQETPEEAPKVGMQ
ncbi:MAG: PDZ domain-containing protein [Deltaproteobacteria bacterium]|nr:PDZ domain-containing protein [Deltaproteobacteria bacterium]